MEEQLISTETAKLARQKQFRIPTRWFYEGEEVWGYNNRMDWNEVEFDEFNEPRYNAPTQALLQRWLREVHNIDVDVTRDSEIHYQNETRWLVRISNWNKIIEVDTPIAKLKHPEHSHHIDFKSFEEALEAGLIHALNLI